jgi:hypothetical protein
VEWVVLFDEDFDQWLESQEEGLQDEIWSNIGLLVELGPNLHRPRVDTVKGSAFPNMKELRIQYQGDPWRILFAFDPARQAILLVGGNKRGKKRWYEVNVRIADERFERHLRRTTQRREN